MPLSPSSWSFDIDKYLNPLVPPSILPRLPTVVSHFLGHRKQPRRAPGIVVVIFWGFIGVFASLSLIVNVTRRVPQFQRIGAPLIIGSFGAAAVLEFHAIESPLSQPRNVILGQAISSLVGVSIAKLFALHDDFSSLRWVASALACACATAIMALTGTVHPPAGATALLAVADERVLSLGWWLVPLVMLSCTLMLGVALLVNNIQRRFPLHWWTPAETGSWFKKAKATANEETEYSKGSHMWSKDTDVEAASDHGNDGRLVVARGTVLVPRSLWLSPEERQLLDKLSVRI